MGLVSECIDGNCFRLASVFSPLRICSSGTVGPVERASAVEPFELMLDLHILVVKGLFDRSMQAAMSEVVDGVSLCRQQTSLELVQSLSAGLKVLPAVLDAGLDGCVIAQLEVQRMVVR